MSILRKFIVSCLFSLSSQLAADGCHDLLINGGRQPKKFSEIARDEGLEYLMISMSPKHFASLVNYLANSRGQRSKHIPATGSGISTWTPEGVAIRDLDGRYQYSMLPLLHRDVGKWAHQMLRSGDYISKGVRIISLSTWKIGLVFPVEILDDYQFIMTSTIIVDDRRLQMISGRGKGIFDSWDETTISFTAILQDIISEDPFPDSFNFHDYLQFHFPQGLPIDRISFLWIPEPLVKWIWSHPREFLTLSGTEGSIDSTEEPIEVMISRRVDGDRWESLQPPPDRAPWKLVDPSCRIGTWYNVIPDWREIGRIFAKKEKQPLIPNFLISELPEK